MGARTPRRDARCLREASEATRDVDVVLRFYEGDNFRDGVTQRCFDATVSCSHLSSNVLPQHESSSSRLSSFHLRDGPKRFEGKGGYFECAQQRPLSLASDGDENFIEHKGARCAARSEIGGDTVLPNTQSVSVAIPVSQVDPTRSTIHCVDGVGYG